MTRGTDDPADDWLAAFMAAEQLPPGFRRTFDAVVQPLTARAAAWRAQFHRPVVIGLCGSQGSGKSTLAAATVAGLTGQGLSALALSLDDFYLGRDARTWLARRTHPLLQTRGPPGTHDVALACAVLDHLDRPGAVPLPSFDKASDERRPRSAWRQVEGPIDVVILEGWCVGARPQPAAALREPVNALERTEDPSGAWRAYVNRQLAEAYQALFARLDRLVLLAAPGFEVVRGWRAEQERKLRARAGGGMTDAEVGRFIQHYERLTRWILDDVPARADWVVLLDEDRVPIVA